MSLGKGFSQIEVSFSLARLGGSSLDFAARKTTVWGGSLVILTCAPGRSSFELKREGGGREEEAWQKQKSKKVRKNYKSGHRTAVGPVQPEVREAAYLGFPDRPKRRIGGSQTPSGEGKGREIAVEGGGARGEVN